MIIHTLNKPGLRSLLDEGPYASFYVETGISGFERLVHSDESMRRLSAAESIWESSSAYQNPKTNWSESEGGTRVQSP